jgi:hypothetical protein
MPWAAHTPIKVLSGGPRATAILPGGTVFFEISAEDFDRHVDYQFVKDWIWDTPTAAWTTSGGTITPGAPSSNGNGQFFFPATWTAPTVPGDYTIRVVLDDQNDANKVPAGAGTRDDPPVERTWTVKVVPAVWAPLNGIPTSGITEPTTTTEVAPNAQIACIASPPPTADFDSRTTIHGTTYYEAENIDTLTYKWSANAGSFLNGVDTGMNVTWVAPDQEGRFTITLTVDDEAVIPPGEGGSRDDPPRVYTVTFGCTETWEADPAIPTPSLSASGGVTPGGIVDITATWATTELDTLRATRADGTPASYDGRTTPNATFASFTDGGKGGAFGKLDASGNFVPVADPLNVTNSADVTHYRAGTWVTVGSPITLTLKVDDIPEGPHPITGEEVTTADDAACTVTAQVTPRLIHLHVSLKEPLNPGVPGSPITRPFLPIPTTVPDGSWPVLDGDKEALIECKLVPTAGALTPAEKQDLAGAFVTMKLAKVSHHPGEDSTSLPQETTPGADFSLHRSDPEDEQILTVELQGTELLIREPLGDLNGNGRRDEGLVLFPRDMRALALVTARIAGLRNTKVESRVFYVHPGFQPGQQVDFTGAADPMAPADPFGAPTGLVVPLPCPGANVSNIEVREVPRAWWDRQRQQAIGLGLPDPGARPANVDHPIQADVEPRGPHYDGGDNYSVWQEYGGYPWSGGPGGPPAKPDGRRRLSAYRKEMVLQISIMHAFNQPNVPLVTPEKAQAAVTEAVTAFGEAGWDLHWAWNYAIVPDHTRAVRATTLDAGGSQSITAPGWVKHELPSEVLDMRRLLDNYRARGMRSIVFGDVARGRLTQFVPLNAFGYADFIPNGHFNGAMIFEGLIVPRHLNNEAMQDQLRKLTSTHELGHLRGIAHLNLTAGFELPDGNGVVPYSDLLMFGGYQAQHQRNPNTGKLYKATRVPPRFYPGDAVFVGGEVGMMKRTTWNSTGWR